MMTELSLLDPADAQSWYLLGRTQIGSREDKKAYESYQQAVDRDDRNPTLWCSIGVSYFQIDQYREALDAYSRAIRINPSIWEVWFNLGCLYESCNDQTSDAIDAYARASELDPDNTAISLRLALLKHAQFAGGQVPAAPDPHDVIFTVYASAVGSLPGFTGREQQIRNFRNSACKHMQSTTSLLSDLRRDTTLCMCR
jgi:cytochrome c-type biogenesis protein CcmH/NrfG